MSTPKCNPSLSTSPRPRNTLFVLWTSNSPDAPPPMQGSWQLVKLGVCTHRIAGMNAALGYACIQLFSIFLSEEVITQHRKRTKSGRYIVSSSASREKETSVYGVRGLSPFFYGVNYMSSVSQLPVVCVRPFIVFFFPPS